MDLKLQRVLDRVELVSGIGDRDEGTMCIMSLVACLAGEKHTDRPACASPVIRAFAIRINDHMPRETRQRLKLFAPRILDTNDGLEGERATVLRRALMEEILPRAPDPCRAPAGALPGAALFRGLWTRLRRHQLHRRIKWLVEESEGRKAGRGIALAAAAAQLLALCAHDARDAKEEEWCWNSAIGLLDQLCDVGASARCASRVRADRIAWLETSLSPRSQGGCGHVAPARVPTPAGTAQSLDGCDSIAVEE